MIERMTRPATAVLRAACRPATYPGHIREATSTLVTASMWPLGLADRRRETGGEPVGSPVDTPVLLVHGFGANKSNWLFVRRYLHQAGFGRVDAMNYNPLTNDIPTLAMECSQRAEALKARYDVDRVHLIGHSLGGIILRYAVQVDGLTGVGVAATVSSPHGGNSFAGVCSRLGFGRRQAGLDLAPDSEVMTKFRTTAAPGDTHFVAYYSNLDLIVSARRAMILEPELNATNILIKDHGHLSIMLSRRLASSVAHQLGAVEGLAGFGAPVTQFGARAGTEHSGRDLPWAVGQ